MGQVQKKTKVRARPYKQMSAEAFYEVAGYYIYRTDDYPARLTHAQFLNKVSGIIKELEEAYQRGERAVYKLPHETQAIDVTKYLHNRKPKLRKDTPVNPRGNYMLDMGYFMIAGYLLYKGQERPTSETLAEFFQKVSKVVDKMVRRSSGGKRAIFQLPDQSDFVDVTKYVK